MMTLSERRAADRAAKAAKLQAREAKRPVNHVPDSKSPTMQNRVLLANDASRFSADELLEHQLRVHLFLQWILDEHHMTAAYYLQTLLDTIKALNIIQPRPKRMEVVAKAEQELAHSATATHRSSHFVALKPLLVEYAAELVYSSKVLQVDCNIHAYHSLLLQETGRLVNLEWQAQAFPEVVRGMSIKAAALQYQVSEAKMKAGVLQVADILYHTNFLTYKEPVPYPATISDIRCHAKHYLMYDDDAKYVASVSARSVVGFKQMYGDALVDVSALAKRLQAA